MKIQDKIKTYLNEAIVSTTVGQAYDFNPTNDILGLPGIFGTSAEDKPNIEMENEVQGTRELKDYIKKYNEAKGNLLNWKPDGPEWDMVDWKILLKNIKETMK